MRKSVSEFLSEKYGSRIIPGKKGECPFCGRKTFQIKRDDTIGKCFHPQCGESITLFKAAAAQKNNLHGVLDKVFNVCHKNLLHSEDSLSRTAYKYINEERKIEPQVIADAKIGVIPSSFNIVPLFEETVKELKLKLLDVAAKSDDKSKESVKEKEKIEESLKQLVQNQDTLQGLLSKIPGWICFFYTDKYHRIVSIRFRKPYTKKFTSYKPSKSISGLFGKELFGNANNMDMKDSELIINEGEFNTLQLQSLMLRKPGDTDYVNACAVGSSNFTKFNEILELSNNPVFCYDNDNAGLSLIKNAQKGLSFTAFTTPEGGSDLDDFIRKFGEDYQSAFIALKNLISERQEFFIDISVIAGKIRGVRRDGDIKAFEKNQRVSSIIISDLGIRAELYKNNNQIYVFLKEGKKVFLINDEEPDYKILMNRYGLNPSETIYRYVMEELKSNGILTGKDKEIYPTFYYDSSNFVLYISMNRTRVLKITADAVKEVDNGSDGILFLSNTHSEDWDFVPAAEQTNYLHTHLLSRANFEGSLLTDKEQQTLLMLFIYSIFFKTNHPTKPILLIFGIKGSGKTTILKMIGSLLYGSRFQVTSPQSDVKDFAVTISNNEYVALDNIDNAPKWLNDYLAVIATGGSFKQRQLYTNSTLVEYPADAFVGISARTPHFRRDDVADRLLILKVDRFESFIPEKKLIQGILENRGNILSEIIMNCQEIIQSLKLSANKDYVTQFRMADFGVFSLKIADGFGIRPEVEALFKKISTEQSIYALEEDSTAHLISIWAKENLGKIVTYKELFIELYNLSQNRGLSFPFKRDGHRNFSQHLRNILPNLENFYQVTKEYGQSRTRKIMFESL